jgi:hypothetical protein
MPGPSAEHASEINVLFPAFRLEEQETTQIQFLFSHRHQTVLSLNIFLHHDIALIVELVFVPVGAMGQMMLSRGRVNGKLLGHCFVVGSSFISAGF